MKSRGWVKKKRLQGASAHWTVEKSPPGRSCVWPVLEKGKGGKSFKKI